jgi:putative isomerase
MYDSTALVGSLMNLHDVGLNSLYLSDCESLSHLAGILGKDFLPQKNQLEKTAALFKKELQTLYAKKDGLFLNRYTETKSPSRIFSPTLLYPMLTSSPTPVQVKQMIDSLLLHPSRLGGNPGLPSIARNHPDFGKQRYWKGSVWPPLNFLVHQGLIHQNRKKEASALAETSFRLFMDEYKRSRFICENYSSINGRCDDPLINSEPYYFWGGLLALLKMDF